MLAAFLAISTPQETYRMFDGRGQIEIDGEQYVGAGQLVEVSEISHSSEPVQNEMTITLNGASDTIVALAMQENYQNQEVLFEIAKFDDDMNLVFKKSRFDGFISHAEINDRAEGDRIVSDIVFHFTTEQLNERRTPLLIYSSNAQKRIDPQDTIFDRLPDLAGQELVWGRGELRGS